MAEERPHDLVLFGATGFTGGLTAEYLARNAPDDLRFALAGRSRERLEAVRDRVAAERPAWAELPLLHADASDPGSLREVVGATRVIATTVGPYIRYGEPLVAACAEAGTDYADLVGEPEFVDLMYVRHHERAVASGARIVHCCGFDSIPADLGAYYTVSQLPEGVPIQVEGFVRAGGRPSGGTLHSAVTGFSRAAQTLKAARDRRQREPRPSDRRVRALGRRPRYERAIGAWAIPLPTIDPQIVRRSARALDRYGPDFSYGHYAAVKRLPVAAAGVAGVAGIFALSQLSPTRKLLLRRLEPGEGPSAEQRAKGWFSLQFLGEGGGRSVQTEVSGGDPGYGETAKMLGETALCLARDELPERAGQLTTAAAMGDRLLDRLQAAGIGFETVDASG